MADHAVFLSPLGPITLTAEGGYITGMHFSFSPAPTAYMPPELELGIKWLEAYFAGKAPNADLLPLKPAGTVFQQTVWNALANIPYGESTTYGAIARSLGPRMSPQAVGQAVGRNPIAIAIPCHRVLGSGGRLTGYAAGLERKIRLLQLEHIPFLDDCGTMFLKEHQHG